MKFIIMINSVFIFNKFQFIGCAFVLNYIVLVIENEVVFYHKISTIFYILYKVDKYLYILSILD
ncbi:unknown [Staphylococcus sp. CAG:324]|nr:unknown [Staphylococcus sp. CAG:324]